MHQASEVVYDMELQSIVGRWEGRFSCWEKHVMICEVLLITDPVWSLYIMVVKC